MFLKHSIRSILCAMLFSSASGSAQVLLPEIEVTAAPARTILLGPISYPTGNNYWSWPDTDTGYIYPEPYTQPADDVCAVLAATGRPVDCTREAVASYLGTYYCGLFSCVLLRTDAPSLPRSSLCAAEDPMNPTTYCTVPQEEQQRYTDLFGSSEFSAGERLESCYSDPSFDPETCEEQWADALNVCDQDWAKQTAAIAAQCTLRLEWARQWLQVARLDRRMAEWVGLAAVAERRGIEVNVNVPLNNIFANADLLNRVYAWFRKGSACSRWYSTWDSHHCSAAYGNT